MQTTLNDDPKFHNKLDAIVDRSKVRTGAFLQLYADAISYMYGDQIHKKRTQGWEYPAMNRVFADITQEVAMLSANNPKLETLPVEDSDYATAKTCGEIIQGYWQGSLQMQMKILQALYDSHLSGIYIFHWYWEPMARWNKKLKNGLGDWEGDIVLNVVNPCYFGCDPDVELCSQINSEAKYITMERWVDMEWAAHRWPVYKNYLKNVKGMQDAGDSYWIAGAGDGDLQESGSLSSTGVWTGKELKEISSEVLQSRLASLIKGHKPEEIGDPSRSSRMVKVQTILWRDWAEEDVPQELGPYKPNPEADSWEFQNLYKDAGVPFVYDRNFPAGDGHEIFDPQRSGSQWPQVEINPAYTRPKYPNGRITIRLDDKCVVEDRPWQYEKWNVAVGVNYLLPHIWNGLNGVELVREMQDYLNNISCHFLNNVKHHSDPAWIVETETVVNKNPKSKLPVTISNAAGAIIEVIKGGLNKIKRQEAKEVPQSLFMLYDVFKGTIQDIDGVHDIFQGKASQKDNTLGELQMLNRNTRLRIAMQGLILDHTLKDVGMGIAELMRTHLPLDRWLRYVGQDQDAVNGSIMWTEDMAEARYDIIMVPASTLPYDEEREIAKLDKAIEALGGPTPTLLKQYLRKMGVVDYKQILKEHAIMGPLVQMLEMAQQMQMGPEQVSQAVQQLLSQLSALGMNAPQKPQGVKTQ